MAECFITACEAGIDAALPAQCQIDPRGQLRCEGAAAGAVTRFECQSQECAPSSVSAIRGVPGSGAATDDLAGATRFECKRK